MKSTLVLLLWSTLYLVLVKSQDFSYDEEPDDDPDDYLYSKIDCKVGDKYHYVMATQSSLLNDNKENLQFNAKLDLECLQKANWLNETTGEMKPGQIFEARIVAIQPIRNIAITKKGQLQMAALFANLKDLEQNPDSNKDGNQNVKLGAVNGFFADLGERFSKWLAEMFEKFVKMLQRWANARKKAADLNSIDWQCDEKNNSRISRRRRDSGSKPINLDQFTTNYSDMFKHPFKFIQLEDGSIQNIQISKEDKDPNVIQYKKFLARAFGTNLDERKKMVLEESEFGTHFTHYKMEYDEPESEQITPERYIFNSYSRGSRNNKKFKRDAIHMVSVLRQFNKEDIIKNNAARQKFQQSNRRIGQLDFDVKEVQLIKDNMVVASGGYFQGFLADDQDRSGRLREKRSFEDHVFDKFLKEHLDLNLQYSMVKLGDNRKKRSVMENDDSESTINYADRIVKRLLLFSSSGRDVSNKRRIRRNAEPDSVGKNKVVCQKVPRPADLDLLDNTIVKDEEYEGSNSEFMECYEYKRFGSDMLNVGFNKSIITRTRKDKSLENFQSKYKVAAKLFNVDLFAGTVDLAKYEDQAKLSVNLFGSEYDVNLCDIRDKVFSHSDSISLYEEDIWFITNVGMKIKYKLDLKLDIPNMNCPVKEKNNEILRRVIREQLEINQHTNMEFGADVQATMLILNGQMKINGNLDMDSLIDFSGSCLSAKSHVKPMDVSVGFNYGFFHPICGKWMMDHWRPKPLSWELNKEYKNSWIHNACTR